MRGVDSKQSGMFSYVSLESRVPQNHPLRAVRPIVDAALSDLCDLFDKLYSCDGRRSIPPERLMRALVLQVLYSIRSERLLVEQLDYNLLFRWFVGMEVDDPVWDHSTFSKNRDRLLSGDVARRFFDQILEQARRAGLTSDEHFSVDGTLIEAWASHKSFRAKDGSDDDNSDGPGRNAGRNFHGEKRTNETHRSTSDPQARMARKSHAHPAKLSYAGHVLMENRNGLVVDVMATQATGTAEREAAVEMLHRRPSRRPATLGADKGYDAGAFVGDVRAAGVTPHVAQNETGRRRSNIDGRTTRHPGYELSQRIRKRIEEAFGWAKVIGGVRKARFRGLDLVDFQLVLAMTGYNLVRMRNLSAPP